jgi:hypothetical protein
VLSSSEENLHARIVSSVYTGHARATRALCHLCAHGTHTQHVHMHWVGWIDYLFVQSVHIAEARLLHEPVVCFLHREHLLLAEP